MHELGDFWLVIFVMITYVHMFDNMNNNMKDNKSIFKQKQKNISSDS